MSRSTFPTSIDSFVEHYDIQASDVVNVKRFQELKSKTILTPTEQTELTNLTITLRSKLFTPEDFNKMQDCIVELETFFKNEVEGYIDIMQDEVETFVITKQNEITNSQTTTLNTIVSTKDSALIAIEDKKNNIIEYMDGTTAGALRNDIGIMADLQTVDKVSLVNAVNEVKNSVPSTDGFIPHSLATAVNSFLVSTGIGVFASKTITDVKTLLGINAATPTQTGVVELATQAEVTTGTDTTKVVVPSTLKTELDKKINHSLATAVNDFLVGGGAGVFVKKTLAEIKVILGLGSSAYLDTGTTASTVALGNHLHTGVYATSAQGTLATNALPKSGGTMSGEVNHADNLVTRAKIKDYSESLGTVPATTGAVTLDISTGNVFDLTPTGAVTLAFTNPIASGSACSISVIIRQPSTMYAITFPASVTWEGDTIPAFTASKTAVLTFITVNGGTRWYGFAGGVKFTN